MPGAGAARSADAIVEAVAATGLLGDAVVGDGPLLLMCSAGRDSHALLDVAVRLRGASGVRVLHVDHGLRDGAAVDADQLRARCAVLGVAVSVRRAGPRPAGGNLHAWARAERARLATEELATTGGGVLASAHTRSDLVETALARLATQPGRRAFLAMRDREDGLVRPLLEVTREETAAYCRARGIAYRDDPSNADPRFSRARLRHGVVPVLRSLNPRAEEAIARTLDELAAESAALDALVGAELGEEDPNGGGARVAVGRLGALPAPVARLVLRALCERSVGRPCPRSAGRLEEVLGLAAVAERSGVASVDAGDGARIELRGGWVRCVPSRGVAAPSVR